MEGQLDARVILADDGAAAVGDVDQRIEWKLPADWRQKDAPPSTAAPAATEAPAPAPAPATAVVNDDDWSTF